MGNLSVKFQTMQNILHKILLTFKILALVYSNIKMACVSDFQSINFTSIPVDLVIIRISHHAHVFMNISLSNNGISDSTTSVSISNFFSFSINPGIATLLHALTDFPSPNLKYLSDFC